jgi:hypothetical protein
MALGLRIVAQVTRHDAGDGFPLGLTNPPHMAAQPPLRGTRRFLENFFVTPALSVPSWNGARGYAQAAAPIRREKPKGLKSQVNCLSPAMCFNPLGA